ncbi:hypothetical protein B0H13DRAFT_1889952 [Mycena leptocephala]|nr:hypothetical protein B0H13DRAFT_1889952 [Mycena leptocephala]
MELGLKVGDTSHGRLQNIRVLWLAFIIYWAKRYLRWCGLTAVLPFGLLDANSKPITSKTNAISSNVVSFLQARAFFGTLGRNPTLVLFTLVFSLDTALTTAASVH